MICVVLMLFVLAAPQAFAAANWKQKNIRFRATAGETLTKGQVVYLSGSDGKAYKAVSGTSTMRPAVGIVGDGGASGYTVEIVVSGIITGMTAASPGTRLFLDSAVTGGVTDTAPTNAQIIGWVLPGTTNSSTKYYIDVTMPLSAGAAY